MKSRLQHRVRRIGKAPAVSLRAWLWGGSRVETVPGQALLTGRLLAEGVEGRDWREIAVEAEDRGMMLYSYGAGETITVAIDALSMDWRLALERLADLVLRPTFPEDRFEWLRRQAMGELESFLDQPDVLAGHAFRRQLYGKHSYGRFLQGNPESLASLTPADCSAFHAASLDAGGFVAAAGVLDEEEVRSALEEFFPASQTPPSALSDPRTHDELRGAAATPQRQEVRLPGAEQAFLFLGDLTVPRLHEDRFALGVLGVVLGAGAGLAGRLPSRVREQEGLAYHVDVGTTSGAGHDPGRFVVFVGTSPQTVEAAENAVREELDRLLRDGVTQEELDEARSYLIGRDPFRRETSRQWAEILGEVALYGVRSDDPDWIRENLLALTTDDVEAAARRWIVPERLKTTIGLPA